MGYTRARTVVKRTVRLVDRHEEHVDERHHESEQQLVHRAGCNSGRKAAVQFEPLCGIVYFHDLPEVALGLEIAVQPAERTAQRRRSILDDGGFGHAQQQPVQDRHADRVEHYGQPGELPHGAVVFLVSTIYLVVSLQARLYAARVFKLLALQAPKGKGRDSWKGEEGDDQHSGQRGQRPPVAHYLHARASRCVHNAQ
eukprot:scaffold5290_cov63-Phaeocystis_antarctica.AAC.3